MSVADAAPDLQAAEARHDRLRAQGLVWRRGGVTLRRCARGLVAFMSRDRYIGAALEHMGEVNERDFAMLRDLVRPGDWVIDVGANIGIYALFFGKRVAPGGRVLSIEPQPRIARLLQTNLALNALHHVGVFQGGMADAPGRLQLPAVDYERGRNFGGVTLSPRGSGISVEVRTIDSIPLERCDFIKIDVEGMESAVFAGALATIRRFHPVLWMESDRPGAADQLAPLAKAEGYSCWELAIQGERPRNFYRRPRNIFLDLHGASYRTQELLALPPGRPEPNWLRKPPPGVRTRLIR